MEKLRQLTQEFNNYLNAANVGLYDRPRATAILAANVVGRDLMIPSTRVDSAKSYYRNAVQSAVYNSLNEINEVLPLDMDCAEELIYRLWYTRYILVHEPQHPLGRKLLSLTVASGISEVDNATVDFLKSYPTLLQGAEYITDAE